MINRIAKAYETAKADAAQTRLFDQNGTWELFDDFTATLKGLWSYTDARSYKLANLKIRILEKLTQAYQADTAEQKRSIAIECIAMIMLLIDDTIANKEITQ